MQPGKTRACWLHYFAEADLEFPVASPVQKSASRSQQNFPRVDLTRCARNPFSSAKPPLADPLLSRLRWFFESPKCLKTRIFPAEKLRRHEIFARQPSRESCSPLGTKERNHGHNKRRPPILRRIFLAAFGRQPLQKTFFFAGGEAEFLRLFSRFCRF